MDPRFPPLAAQSDLRPRSLALPVAALPMAEWAIFAALLSLLVRV